MVALFLLLSACAAGVLLAHRLDPSPRLLETLALGAAMGLAILAGFGFILGWGFGLSARTVIGAAFLTIATGAGLGAAPSSPLGRARKLPSAGVLLLSVAVAALVGGLADRALIQTDTGIATGDRHNFGDLPFHMAIAAGFAYGENFPPAHPELAGVALTYPFFCDLLSGMILALGGSWRDAFFWPTLILGLSMVVALVRFGETVTGSRSLGRVGAGLTLFSGGLGFSTLTSAEKVLDWWNGPDITMNDAGVRYANFITTLFIPQRAILFGWPLLFFALALLVESLKDETSRPGRPSQSQLWLRAGVLASLLPLVHAHSFAVLGFCALVLTARASMKAPLSFVRGVLPVALPAIVFMLTHNSLSAGQFLEWQPGFDGGADHPLRYWFMNAGLFLPLVVVGIARTASTVRFLGVPFAALFLLANLFRLSPWIWDNMKFLAPAHAGLAPFAAMALAILWKRHRMGKALAVACFAGATLSGALDISKVLARGEFGLFDRTGLTFAENIRAATAPTTTILTAPTHNHPALLSGRRLFLGYEGHLWSQGLDYAGRKPVADAVFQGRPRAAPEETALIRIDAVALTPAEQPLIPDPRTFEGLPSLVDSPYRLLKVR